MNFTVIVFAPNGAIGQESFALRAEADAYDTRMLDMGNTTSGVLGEENYF